LNCSWASDVQERVKNGPASAGTIAKYYRAYFVLVETIIQACVVSLEKTQTGKDTQTLAYLLVSNKMVLQGASSLACLGIHPSV